MGDDSDTVVACFGAFGFGERTANLIPAATPGSAMKDGQVIDVVAFFPRRLRSGAWYSWVWPRATEDSLGGPRGRRRHFSHCLTRRGTLLLRRSLASSLHRGIRFCWLTAHACRWRPFA